MACVHADNKPAEMPKAAVKEDQAPSASTPAGARRLGRLTQPWNKLTGLSEEQKTKIREIHTAAIAEIHTIEAREKQDILALLSDEQKTELKSIEAEAMAARKKRSAAAKQEAPSAE
jgi:Spy/CpxP family protein refolding chaperone